MNRPFLLLALSGAALVGLFFVGTTYYQKSQSDSMSQLAIENRELFIRDHSPTQGASDAKVILTEYLDPECESCAAFYPIVKEIMKAYDGKVLLVIRYAPFHGNSKFVIAMLEAIRKQGKYWEALGAFFERHSEWASHHHPKPEFLWTLLPPLGIDVEQVKKDMLDSKIIAMIQQEEKDLMELGVQRTPSFFVNGRPLTQFGRKPLIELIESEIKKFY